MSKELREKADIIIKELKELLIPVSYEIKQIKSIQDKKDNYYL